VADFHTYRSFSLGVLDLCPLVRSRHNLNRRPAKRGLPKAFPFDQIIATSEAERSHLVLSGAARADRITVVGEWADESFFAPLPSGEAVAARRASLGLPAGDFVIGACAMLRPDNDFAALLGATARLRQRGLPVSCLVVGGPPEDAAPGAGDSLRRLAEKLEISDSVRFLGHRPDVPDLLDAMDVAAVVSRHTAQTRVGPEAAARGRPVVGFSVGALGETVSEGKTGLLVGLDDIDAFTGAVERLLRDKALRDQMGGAAAKHAEFNFRQAAKMEQTLAAYRQADARRIFPASGLGVHPLSLKQAR
jgi:D-inositol-3-phosphate glycosyltransferase